MSSLSFRLEVCRREDFESVRKPVGVPHRKVLRAVIAVMDQTSHAVAAPVVDRLLERVQDKVRDKGRGDALADDTARKDVDYERDIRSRARSPRR